MGEQFCRGFSPPWLRAWFAYAYAKKAKYRNIKDEKGGDKQKKQES